MQNELTPEAILEREFKSATGNTTAKAIFHDDETIGIYDDNGNTWIMQIGSDDDKLIFTNHTGATISFDYPSDWPA